MSDLHVLPIDDMREHEESRACWCRPMVTREADSADAVIVHHADDGRELIEQHGLQ